MNHRTRKIQSGFTIVEILIGAAISLILFYVGFAILKGTSDSRRVAQARTQLANNARLFFQLLEEDLKGAWPGPWSPDNLHKEDLWMNSNSIVLTTPLDSPYNRADLESEGLLNTDDPDPEYVSVRYYIGGSSGLVYLHREISYVNVEYDTAGIANPAIDKSGIFPSATPPSTGNINDALFDDVQALQVHFLQWNSSQKRFDAINPPPSDVTGATHINVELKLENTDGTPRTFSRIFTIPATYVN